MQNERTYNNDYFCVVKGVLLALGVSLLSAIVFAAILRATSWGETMIYPINQTIKVISIAIGGLVFVRGEKGWLKGGVVGLLFTALSYLAFSSLGGDFSLSWMIVIEFAISFLTGVVSGCLAVNVRA